MTDFQLFIQKGPEPGKIFPLTSASVTIGRDPMVEITIDDAEVSRQHTRLTRTYSGYQVHDLGSTNGTYLDGVRLGGEAVTLQPGQILALGSGVSIIYQIIPETEKDYEAAVLVTMLDAPTQPPEEPIADISDDEEVARIEWSEAVIDEEDVIEAKPSEQEMAGFSESGTEILFAAPQIEPVDEAAVPIIKSEPAQDDWEADDQPIPEPESVRAEPFVWDASPDSETLIDFDEIETETAVDPPSEQTPPIIDTVAKPPETIDQPAKPKPNNRRIITILLIILILLCCCACGFFYFMYTIGGDLIIDAIMEAGAIQ